MSITPSPRKYWKETRISALYENTKAGMPKVLLACHSFKYVHTVVLSVITKTVITLDAWGVTWAWWMINSVEYLEPDILISLEQSSLQSTIKGHNMKASRLEAAMLLLKA